MKKINGFIRFARQENGGVTAIFMIMLPMMLAFLVLALDGSRAMMKRARLADALNEAALAISAGASNGDTGGIDKNNALLRQYINHYLPGDEVIVANVSTRAATGIDPESKETIFDIKAEIKFNTILPMSELPSFSKTLNLNNQGSVRKNISPERSADYVFVVDFSSSMHDPSSESGVSRIDLLKKVVKDITDKALKDRPASTFGFVPFELGVPVKLEGKNEAGGDRLGCSALFVPNKGYGVNYAFWANKDILANPGDDLTVINRQLDAGRYNYFIGPVLSSLGLKSIAYLLIPPYNYCAPNTHNQDVVGGNHVAFHCESEAAKSIYTQQNQIIIDKEFHDAYSARTKGLRSIFNDNSIDYKKTLENMFDDSAVISFEQSGPANTFSTYNPYGLMCTSRGAKGNNIKEYKRNTYLVELTNDKAVIDEFQYMSPDGGTESSVGLLRAVPVLTKGLNPRKVMIIISDGEDLFPMLPKAFHETHNVCEKIRQGIPKHSPGTEEVSIYFISISASSADDQRVKYWGQHCTGMENSVTAANYSDLMAKLVEITNDAEEAGFFNVD